MGDKSNENLAKSGTPPPPETARLALAKEYHALNLAISASSNLYVHNDEFWKMVESERASDYASPLGQVRFWRDRYIYGQTAIKFSQKELTEFGDALKSRPHPDFSDEFVRSVDYLVRHWNEPNVQSVLKDGQLSADSIGPGLGAFYEMGNKAQQIIDRYGSFAPTYEELDEFLKNPPPIDSYEICNTSPLDPNRRGSNTCGFDFSKEVPVWEAHTVQVIVPDYNSRLTGVAIQDPQTHEVKILASSHVIPLEDDGSNTVIRLKQGSSEAVGRIVRIRRELDLMTISILASTSDFNPEPARLSAVDPKRGDQICALGDPKGHTNIVSCGRVTEVNATIFARDRFGRVTRVSPVSTTNQVLFEGNSGSPIFMAGHPDTLYGIASAGRPLSFNVGNGVFIPPSKVRMAISD
jgi:hypothetical protein